MFQLLPVPLHGAAKPLLETDGRFITKGLAGGADVGQRVLDIAGTRRSVDGGLMEAGEFGEDLVGLIEGVPLAAGHIEDTSGHLFRRCGGGEKIGGNGIFHIGEITALFAVAEDGGLLAVEHLEGKFRHDAAVRRVGVLAGTEDVEIAQADGFNTIDLPIAAHVELTGHFLDGVRGNGHGHHGLYTRKAWLVSIGRGGGSVEDASDSSCACAFEHVEGAVDVGGVAGAGVFDGAGNGGQRTLVKDDLDPLTGPRDGGLVAQIALNEFDAVQKSGEVFPVSGFKIIKAADGFSAFYECLRDPGTNKTSASGDQITCHLFMVPGERGLAEMRRRPTHRAEETGCVGREASFRR